MTVIGLGRIGLPHALVSADSGNIVYGVDKSKWLIEKLERGICPFKEPELDKLLLKHLNKNFFVSNLEIALHESNVIVVCIGTRVSENIDEALKPVLGLAEAIAPYLRKHLVIWRTTLPIGTTRKIKEVIESKGLREGRDFYLVFSPERLVEGRAVEEERKLPKIIGGFSEEGYRLAEAYFKTIGGDIIRVSCPEVAELVKLIDNAWRQLTFSFANDIALLCESLGIDVLEVINAANYKYPRNKIPLPSYGVSGYCLTKDPHLLEVDFKPIASIRGFHSVWIHGRKANDYMIEHVCMLVDMLMSKYRKRNSGVIVIAGLTFKEDVDDFRLSHGIEITKRLKNRHKVRVYDPYYDPNNPYTSIDESLEICSSLEECLVGADIVIFTVRHREFRELEKRNKILKLAKLMNKPPIIIDGWNIFKSLYRNKHGIIYWAVGRSYEYSSNNWSSWFYRKLSSRKAS